MVAVNTYRGWYGSSPLKKVPDSEWSNPSGKPFLFSEFGAGAKYGFRDPGLEKFSEDFQVEYYRVTLEMVKKVPGLSRSVALDTEGFSIRPGVCMANAYQDYWNRKGLISPQGDKKAAFLSYSVTGITSTSFRGLGKVTCVWSSFLEDYR